MLVARLLSVDLDSGGRILTPVRYVRRYHDYNSEYYWYREKLHNHRRAHHDLHLVGAKTMHHA